MHNEKITKIASIVVGLLLALVLIYFGFRVLQSRAGRAAVNPDSVSVENVTQNSFSVQFTAAANLEASVFYGTTCSEELSLFAPCVVGASDNSGNVQYTCEVDLVSPDTTYYFRIMVSGQTVDNAGTCFQAKTSAAGSAALPPSTLTPAATRPPKPTAEPIDPAEQKNEMKTKFARGDYSLPQCVAEYASIELNAGFVCIQALASLTVTPTPVNKL